VATARLQLVFLSKTLESSKQKLSTCSRRFNAIGLKLQFHKKYGKSNDDNNYYY